MSDIRSWPSERYAFEILGLQLSHVVVSENEMIHDICEDCTVPEAIFKHPITGKLISVEVKRIVGNNLPNEGKRQRKLIRRRKQIIWPWSSTVEAALSKANETIVKYYMVEEHHVVFIIPDFLSSRDSNRVETHIYASVNNYFEKFDSVIRRNRIFVNIVKGPSELFDRV